MTKMPLGEYLRTRYVIEQIPRDKHERRKKLISV